MAKLSDCIKKMGKLLSKADAEELTRLASEYVADGLPTKQAAERAIADMMAEGKARMAAIAEQARERGVAVQVEVDEVEITPIEPPAPPADVVAMIKRAVDEQEATIRDRIEREAAAERAQADLSSAVERARASGLKVEVAVESPRAQADAKAAQRAQERAARRAQAETRIRSEAAAAAAERAAAAPSSGFHVKQHPRGPEPIDEKALHALGRRVQDATGIPIHVVRDTSDSSVPANVRGTNRDAQAYTDGRSVWLFRENLADMRHAQAALAHEVVGHLGVEAVADVDDWAKIAASVTAIAEGKRVLASKELREAVRAAWKRYPDEPVERRAREAVAVMAERGIRGSLWDHIEAAARRWARRVFQSLTWSDAELRDLVLRAARAAGPGAALDPGAIKGDFFAQKFNPDDPSDAGALLASVSARARPAGADFLTLLGDTIDTNRPTWLKTMTRQQTVDVGKDVLPEAVEFERTARRMEADVHAMNQPATAIAMRWSKLLVGLSANPKAAADLASLMHDSTLYEIDPSKPMRDRPPVTERVHYIRLRKAFEALPADAQKLYSDVRDAYAKRRQDFLATLLERIDRSKLVDSQRESMKAKLRAEFESAALNGPYFPLGRFGQFWVVATRGNEREFAMAETQAQQRELLGKYKALGWTTRHGKSIRSLASDQGPGIGFVARVANVIEEALGSDSQLGAEIRDDVYQLYLESLPDQSVRKSFLHRQGTPGFSSDALRVFAHHMSHGARQLARLRHSDVMAEQLRAMADRAPKTEDPNKAADIVAALDSSFRWMMSPSTATWASRATSLGFLWYLGVSPAAAIVNATQQAMVTFPTLAARFGSAKAAAALARANADYLRAIGAAKRKDLEAERGGDVGRMLDELEQSGAIDRTQTMALAGLSEENVGLSLVEQRVMRVVAWAFQQVERLNREATALAAYRLARDAGSAHAGAVEYAYTVVYQSHYDYSAGNRAPFMRPDMAKVLLLFKQYAQNTTYFLGRAVYEAFRGESKAVRREAFRRLAWTMGMAGAFGGALGVPLVKAMLGTLSLVVALLGGDDDEPFDADTEFRAWLQRTFGSDWGEILATGPANAATGVDIASRTNIDPLALWVRPPYRDLEGRDLALHYLEQAAGPVVGIGINGARGVDLMADGHALRGLEAMVPKAMRDGLKALRFGSEGARSLAGEPIVDDITAWETFITALGFTPARLSAAYDRINAMKEYEADLFAQRRRLVSDLVREYLEGSDPRAETDALNAIFAWNQRNPDVPITNQQINATIAARRPGSGRTVGGVRVNRGVQQRFREKFEDAEPSQ